MILITGATGFLGRNLCKYLINQGYQLRALVRSTSDTSILTDLGVELAIGDVTDEESVATAVEGCEYVVHAAARFRLWGEPEPFYKTNVDGTLNILEASLMAGIKKFIHISTIIVVGPQESDTIITEDTFCRPYPTDHYAKTKYLGERLAHYYHGKGLPVITLRLGALYGPQGHYAFNRLFFEEYLRNLRIQVHQGRHIIFPCYITDASRGIELAIQHGTPGEIYNICDESITHREANAIVSKLANRSSWRINMPAWLILSFVDFTEYLSRFTKREPFYPQNLKPYVFNDWIVDSSKARQELCFNPISFEEGAEETLAWYRSIGYL